jgi:predicted PurR-regulated permease PerM
MGDSRPPDADWDRPGAPQAGPGQPPDRSFHPWSRAFLRHAALWLVGAIAGGVVLAGIADAALHRLAGFLQIIVISLFLSFAIEPAVGYLARRGWRRGVATGLVFLAVLAVTGALVALLVPAVVTGTRQFVSALPDLVPNLAKYLQPLGIRIDQAGVEEQLRKYGTQLLSGAGPLLGGVFRVATGIAGGVLQALAIAFFTFYMVAQGPQMRRAVCARLRPDRQRRLLFIWEQAIGQTGGYFYSRLLLAVINGALMYAVLRWRAVPFAAPLAVFEGVVASFIPIIGTFIAGAAPVLVALLYDPVDALIVLGWIVAYQQIENYLLSPRLTAKTMSLPAPVAFAAALIGGALGGILFAFLALPAAGVILAAARAYGRYYEFIGDDTTVVPALAPEEPANERRGRWPWTRRSRQDRPRSGPPDASPPGAGQPLPPEAEAGGKRLAPRDAGHSHRPPT